MCEEYDRIRIVFIDFGNIETKSINEFFPLDKLYTDLPAQAIACSLSEVRNRCMIDDKKFFSRRLFLVHQMIVLHYGHKIQFKFFEMKWLKKWWKFLLLI